MSILDFDQKTFFIKNAVIERKPAIWRKVISPSPLPPSTCNHLLLLGNNKNLRKQLFQLNSAQHTAQLAKLGTQYVVLFIVNIGNVKLDHLHPKCVTLLVTPQHFPRNVAIYDALAFITSAQPQMALSCIEIYLSNHKRLVRIIALVLDFLNKYCRNSLN